MNAPTQISADTGVLNLAARPFSADLADGVFALFTEPDFFFRTEEPDTRPEWEILDIVDDAQVLLVDGTVAGLFAMEKLGADHGCHYHLDLRLRASAPMAWWHAAFHQAVAALRWRHEVVRLTVQVGEFDALGLAVARSLGLTEEGVLANVLLHDGQRYGCVSFSRIWAAA